MLFTPSDNNNMFDNIHPAGQAVLHLHRLHHSTLLAVSNLIRPCNVCILYVMRVPKYSHLQYSTIKIFHFWYLIPNSNRDWLYYARHRAQDNSRCINWYLWKGRSYRKFSFYSWCITLTGIIGCRAAAEAGSTDTFNAVPLYLVQNSLRPQEKGAPETSSQTKLSRGNDI